MHNLEIQPEKNPIPNPPGTRDTPAKEVADSDFISVLIVTWNRKDDLLRAVRSVFLQDYRNYEVIVVDNGSSDGTVDALTSAYPTVKIIKLDENRGVSAGRNMGIAASSGEIIFCLDSDATLGRGTLAAVAHRFAIDLEAGIINSRILDPDTDQLTRGPGWVYSERQRSRQNEVFPSWSFSEGGAAIRREVFDTAGLFWEKLRFGSEGQDLGLRAWEAGFGTVYDPCSVVYHKESQYSRVGGALRERLFLEGALSIYIVRYPWWMLMVLAPLKMAAVTIRALRHGYFRSVISAISGVALTLPDLLRERKAISLQTAIHYLWLQRQQGPLSWGLRSWLKHKF